MKNYRYSAEQLKIYYYEMDLAQEEVYDDAKKKSMKYSNLKNLFLFKDLIIK